MKNTNLYLAFFLSILSTQLLYAQPIVPLKLKPNALLLDDGMGLVNGTNIGFTFESFPAKNAIEAAEIWTSGSRWTFLNMSSLSGTRNGGAASIDIVSDYLGPIRFSVLGIVAGNKSDSVEEENAERFLAGGGTGVITATLLGPTGSWGKSGYASILISPRLGLDFPALGNSTDDSNANLDLGGEFRLNLPFKNDNLGLFASARAAYVLGGSEFYKKIGLPDDKQDPFAYSQINLGLSLPKLGIALLWVRTLSGPGLITSLHEDGKFSLVVSPTK